MSRKDFELIARCIRDANCDARAKDAIVWQFIKELPATNYAFNERRFLDACKSC